jgi:hypothetical protein
MDNTLLLKALFLEGLFFNYTLMDLVILLTDEEIISIYSPNPKLKLLSHDIFLHGIPLTQLSH